MPSSPTSLHGWIMGDATSPMTFEERARVSLARAAAIGMSLGGPFFAVWNLVIGRYQLLPFNLVLGAAGLLGLFFAVRGSTRWAFAVVAVGASVVFAVGGLLYRNGGENFLLVLAAATVLVVETPRMRHVMAAAYALAFLGVKLIHALDDGTTGAALGLFAVNLVLFLVSLVWFLELARRLSTDYRGSLERTNAELAERRAELAREHAALLERTGELEEANRTKERLFSILAHDLRGPVGTLSQALGMLHEGMLSPEEFQSLIPRLRSDTGAVQECLEGLLAWAKCVLRREGPEILDVSLDGETDAVLRLLGPTAEFKNVKLLVTGSPGCVVRTDRDRLRVVLRNLVSNAIKFTPAGGSVTISANETAGTVRVGVSDTGVGMSGETLRQIREGDVAVSLRGTNNESGTGLGLRLCRELLDEMGARLEASSTPGAGTRMEFDLPAAAAVSATYKEPPEPRRSPATTRPATPAQS